MNNNIFSIAIDGPAGAGKSTIAKIVAEILNFEYIDTGAMFRAITLIILENNINLRDEEALNSILDNLSMEFKDGVLYVNGVSVEGKIRTNYISQNVSNVARLKIVRDKMLKLQRGIAKNTSVVMDGRDIGTVVLPSADFKFFITASPRIRAERRIKDLRKSGNIEISLEELEREIIERDFIDSNREIAPLKESPDSYRIDNSNQTIEESVNEIILIVKRGIDAL